MERYEVLIEHFIDAQLYSLFGLHFLSIAHLSTVNFLAIPGKNHPMNFLNIKQLIAVT
jgi:hypothetical protein